MYPGCHTITITESEETTKTETSSVIIRSSEHLTKQNCKNSKTIQDSKMKKNKNTTLRNSKAAISIEKVETKEIEAEEKHTLEKSVSMTEVDGETDSAIGLSSYSSLSYDSLLNDDQPDLEEMQPLTKPPFKQPKVCEVTKHCNYPIPSNGDAQPFYCTPKIPVVTTKRLYDVKQNFKFKQDKIQPVPDKQECNAFQGQQHDHRASEQTEVDGELSQTQHLKLHQEIEEESSLVCSMAESSLSTFSRAGMSDFVILHTDDDLDAACSFMDHLLNDIGIDDLTVDLLSNIDAGKPGMQSLATLHENYRYILAYITENLESDKYSRFSNELVLTLGLREGNGKEDRVVPVLTRKGYCNIFELSILGGLQYFNFQSSKTIIRDSYVNSVKRLVQRGRTKFP